MAELATTETEATTVEPGEIAELDRRWKKIQGGEPTVPQERVVQWLRFQYRYDGWRLVM